MKTKIYLNVIECFVNVKLHDKTNFNYGNEIESFPLQDKIKLFKNVVSLNKTFKMVYII